MAENETLDLWDRHSRRWQRVLQKIERDEPAEQIAHETVRCIYEVFKNLVELGILDELLRAARFGPEKVREAVRRCHKARDYAELFAQQASIGADPVQIIEGVARATIDRFFDQIQIEVVGEGHLPDMARFRVLRAHVNALVAKDVARLAREVADHPNEKPRMPARSADQREKDQRDLLRHSLQGRRLRA